MSEHWIGMPPECFYGCGRACSDSRECGCCLSCGAAWEPEPLDENEDDWDPEEYR